MTRVRFAPSPTGFVHVGNVRTALFNLLHARRNKGAFILRIEDTDVERSKKEYEENLITDLQWLGIQWDEGPDMGGEYSPYRQSERQETYREYAQNLIDENKAYYCFCTSEELELEKQAGGKTDNISENEHKCRHLDLEESKTRVASGEEAAIRFKIPRGQRAEFKDRVRGDVSFDTNLLNDPVILRSTGIPAYNFSVVIDDTLMKIDLVIRGEDHLSNTARQVLIYRALGLELPEFAHLSMVMGADNTKLSKRHGSTSVAQFRELGYLPEALMNYLALLGWSPGDDKQVMKKEELFSTFSLDKVSKSAAVFDYQKLNWLNREHVRLLQDEELANILIPFLEAQGLTYDQTPKNMEWIGKTAKILSNYHYTLVDIAADFKQFSSLDYSQEVITTLKESEESMTVIRLLHEGLKDQASPISFQAVAAVTKTIQKETGIKGKGLYHPIRLALTGKESGIELSDFIPTIEDGSILGFSPAVQNMKARLAYFL